MFDAKFKLSHALHWEEEGAEGEEAEVVGCRRGSGLRRVKCC